MTCSTAHALYLHVKMAGPVPNDSSLATYTVYKSFKYRLTHGFRGNTGWVALDAVVKVALRHHDVMV